MMALPISALPYVVPSGKLGRMKFPLTCAKRVSGEFCFDIHGSHQLLASSHLRECDKILLRRTSDVSFAEWMDCASAFGHEGTALRRPVHRLR